MFEAIPLLAQMHLFDSLPSTNQWLLDKLAHENVSAGTVCIAKGQTAGRGRQGKTWHSPAQAGFYGSLYWPYPKTTSLTGLSLVVGVQLAAALTTLGAKNLQLKWPNDVLWQDKKLAGILIEVISIAPDMHGVVVGIGVNGVLPQETLLNIDQPAVDLATVLGAPFHWERTTATIIEYVLQGLADFSTHGFSASRQQWQDHDALLGREICVSTPQGMHIGRSLGVNFDGALLLQHQESVLTFYSADVSIRASHEIIS